MNVPASHAARVLTAVVGLCVLAWALIVGGWAWFALVLAACMVGLWEFYALFPAVATGWRLYGLACGAAMLGAAWRFGSPAGLGALLACFWLGLALHLAFGRQGAGQGASSRAGSSAVARAGESLTSARADASARNIQMANAHTGNAQTVDARPETDTAGPEASRGSAGTEAGTVLSPATAHLLVPTGLIYVPGCLLFALAMPAAGVVTVMAAVMATDTGAYYAGHLLGGPKIWPRVSPKKTWAGSLGGLAAALAACLLCALWLGGPGIGSWLVLGLCLSVASQMGDFIESGLKRASGVKDSGAILPGHGGLLDRIDGLLPALLVYALARTLAVFP